MAKPAAADAAAASADAAISDEGRAFAVLADDHAAPDAWRDAAATLVFAPDLDHPDKLRGESLRTRSAPSVGELLARRIATTGLEIDIACELADALLRWDPAAGKPIAAQQMTRAIHATDDGVHGACISALAVDRADRGDRAALDDYAAWLVKQAPGDGGVDRDDFIPMAMFPAQPAIAKASEQLFRDGSPWVPIISPTPRDHPAMPPDYLLEPSTMGRVGGFIAASGLNAHVIQALGDKRVVGKLTVQDGLSIAWNDGGTSSVGATSDPPPANGIKRTIRVCDYYAWHLSAHPGAPAFDLTWPDARRDQAFAAMIAWVKSRRDVAAPRSVAD